MPPDSSHAPASGRSDFEQRLQADCESVRELISGIERLETEMYEMKEAGLAQRLGYFPPDHEDRVKQMLLSYRNHRFAIFEVIHRYRGYRRIAPEERRLGAFMVAYAAALALYTKSLAIVDAFEQVPLVRNKLNEPDDRIGLAAGFFDGLLQGYSSIANYRLLARGTRFWRVHRRQAERLGLARRSGWEWLPDFIRRERRRLSLRFRRILVTRLRYDWRLFWHTGLNPVRRVRYSAQAFIGGTFADYRVDPDHEPCLDGAILRQLQPQLQPGDILLLRAEGKLTSAMLPGFWAHAALYVGGPPELESLGLRANDHVAKHWAHLVVAATDHGFAIEAISPRVHLVPLESALQADHVCVLRPGLAQSEIAAALIEAFALLGKPYDYDFDFNHQQRIVCTELVYRIYHHRGPLSFDLVKRLGRWTLSADDMVNQMLVALVEAGHRTPAPLRPITVALTGNDQQSRLVDAQALLPTLMRIQFGWRPYKVPAAVPENREAELRDQTVRSQLAGTPQP